LRPLGKFMSMDVWSYERIFEDNQVILFFLSFQRNSERCHLGMLSPIVGDGRKESFSGSGPKQGHGRSQPDCPQLPLQWPRWWNEDWRDW
jgi:hypothetical protein